MAEFYLQSEKIQICTDIAQKLKNFKTQDNQIIDLFKESFGYTAKLKKIFNDYIKGDTYFRGTLLFEEIGKKIEYHFPVKKKYNPLFVIKINN